MNVIIASYLMMNGAFVGILIIKDVRSKYICLA